MKKILIALLVLAMSFSFVACGKKDAQSTDTTYFSVEELVNDPEFQKIISDNEDEVFNYSVSSGDSNVLVYEVSAKKTYEEADLDFFRNLTTEEILDKFALADLQKLLKRYGFGNVAVEVKMFNGDGTLITDRTLD